MSDDKHAALIAALEALAVEFETPTPIDYHWMSNRPRLVGFPALHGPDVAARIRAVLAADPLAPRCPLHGTPSTEKVGADAGEVWLCTDPGWARHTWWIDDNTTPHVTEVP